MERNASHFGSYCQPGPVGISSTERASIGGSGGFNSIFDVVRSASSGGRFYKLTQSAWIEAFFGGQARCYRRMFVEGLWQRSVRLQHRRRRSLATLLVC